MESSKQQRVVSFYFGDSTSEESNESNSFFNSEVIQQCEELEGLHNIQVQVEDYESDSFFNTETIDQCEVLECLYDIHVQDEFFNNSFESDEKIMSVKENVVENPNLISIQTGSGRGIKRNFLGEPSTSSSKNQFPINTEKREREKIKCDVCDVMVSRRYFSNHLRSTIHRNKSLLSQHECKNVIILDTAFGSRILSYRILSPQEDASILETPDLFFDSVKVTISKLIDDCLKELTFIKVNFIVYADFVQETKALENSFDFQTSKYTISIGDNLDPYLVYLRETILTKISEFEKKDSGWSFKKIKFLEMNVNKFNPLRGSSYIDLPLDIKTKKAIINVKNNDHECLKWALLSALYPVESHVDRTSSYIRNQNKLNFKNIRFPVKLKDIVKVESNNNISINVFGLEYSEEFKRNNIVGPLYFTKNRKEKHINLLYITNGTNGHYCYIKNMSRLISRQLSSDHHQIFLCDGCLVYFTSNERLKQHQQNDCNHIRTTIPSSTKTKTSWFGHKESSDKIRFDKYLRQLRIPFVIYADTEAFLKPISSCHPNPTLSSTTNIQEHEIYSSVII
ncbi:hypothetical protein evm_008785 [Chilo suppressalis]|nr:hypothetical protein evm_008785 [Chilo suppressalis]